MPSDWYSWTLQPDSGSGSPSCIQMHKVLRLALAVPKAENPVPQSQFAPLIPPGVDADLGRSTSVGVPSDYSQRLVRQNASLGVTLCPAHNSGVRQPSCRPDFVPDWGRLDNIHKYPAGTNMLALDRRGRSAPNRARLFLGQQWVLAYQLHYPAVSTSLTWEISPAAVTILFKT